MRPGGSNREREKRGDSLGEGMNPVGPTHQPLEREGEARGSRPAGWLGRGPGRGARGGGFWAKGRKEEGGERITFPFF